MSRKYIDNKKFYSEMIKFRKAYDYAKEHGETLPTPNNYIGRCIQLIAERFSTKPNFSGYSFVEDMRGDAIENCLLYIHNFDPDKYSNPLAYFTQITYFAFLRRIEKEKKHAYIKYKAMENSMVMNTLVEMAPDDSSHFHAMMSDMDYEKLGVLAEKFETTNKKAPKKKGVEKFLESEE